jgi:hypothetical protein
MSTISIDAGTVLFDAPITYDVFQQATVQELGPAGSVTVNDQDDLVGYNLGGAETWAPLKTALPPDTYQFCAVNCGGIPTAATPEPSAGYLLALFVVAITICRKNPEERMGKIKQLAGHARRWRAVLKQALFIAWVSIVFGALVGVAVISVLDMFR